MYFKCLHNSIHTCIYWIIRCNTLYSTMTSMCVMLCFILFSPFSGHWKPLRHKLTSCILNTFSVCWKIISRRIQSFYFWSQPLILGLDVVNGRLSLLFVLYIIFHFSNRLCFSSCDTTRSHQLIVNRISSRGGGGANAPPCLIIAPPWQFENNLS